MKPFPKINARLSAILMNVVRVGAFAAVAAITVLLFPGNDNAFRYQFAVGRPWNHGLMTAEFDFPIYKSDAQLAREQQQLLQAEMTPCFRYMPSQPLTPLVVSLQDMEMIEAEGYSRIATLQNNVLKTHPLSEVYTPRKAYEQFGKELSVNLQLDTARTNALRESILSKVSPTQGMVQKGEKIIDRGDIVEEEDYWILESLRRAYSTSELSSRQHILSVVGLTIMVCLFLSLFVIYLYVFRRQYTKNLYDSLFFCLNALIILVFSCLLLRYTNLSIYLIPFAWVPILTRVFFDSRTGLFLHFTTVLIVSLIVPAPVEFFFIQVAVGMVAVCSLSDMTRRAQLAQTAGWIFLTQSIAYSAFTFATTGDWHSIDPMMYVYFLVNALLIIGSYGLIYLFEKLFRFTSSVTLVELTDINSELLHTLAQEAPGTFQHSMQVSNLASEAAKAIGANALLVRTGALYHDIGKLTHPYNFTENQQQGGPNPLDALPPIEAAKLVMAHVPDGIALAKKHHLPEMVINFIATHHGTSLALSFYNTYVNKHPDEQVDKSPFQYPGPKPSTKEGAILMMADVVEATSRSMSEYTEATISTTVDKLIDQQIAEGQFSETPLSFKDVEDIRRVFKKRLIAINHRRIAYPTIQKPQ